jgi:IgGFc binding protein
VRGPLRARFVLVLLSGCASRGAAHDSEPAGGDAADAGADTTPPLAIDAAQIDATRPSGGDAGQPCAPYACSVDLHDVTDCNGKTIKTCPPAEGCAPGGTCVPACAAASANRATVGCDYYVVDPGGGAVTCLAAYIVNTWTTEATVSLDYGGQTWNAGDYMLVPSGAGPGIKYAPVPSGKVQPGQVAILFLSSQASTMTNCPMTGPNPAGSGLAGTRIGSAYHIATDVPVVAYDIYPYGGGSSSVTSATLLIPTGAWATNYLAVSPWSDTTNATTPRTNVVALLDGTEVTIDPVAAIVAAPGVAGAAAGQSVTYTLDQGQMLQIDQADELTGSPIQSNKPIGVWGTQMCIDIAECCCDSAHQELPPVQALGHEYVGVRYRNRVEGQPDETPPWTIVGAVSGTVMTWDPAAPAGAPLVLSAGEAVTFEAAGPFVVASQDASHPFYMAAYMTGGLAFENRGDPEFVNLVPPAEWVTSYLFFTDPTYPETDLVVIRQGDAAGQYQDVTLDCAGILSGWQSVGSSAYEYTRVDLVTGDFAPQGTCANGRHTIESSAPFGLTVWGWGSDATSPAFDSTYVSYAYPAGASVQSINDVVLSAGP